MSSPDLLIRAVPRHLRLLSDALTLLSDTRIKAAIRAAEANIDENQETPKKLDLEIVSEPFFIAFDDDFNKYAIFTIDYFATLFHASTVELFPNQKLTERVIKLISTIHKTKDDDIKTKTCKTISFMLLSPCGRLFVHNHNMNSIIHSILRLFMTCQENTKALEVCEMTLHETMRVLIGCYDNLIEEITFETVEELAKYTVDALTLNCLQAIDTMPSYPHHATPHDVDVTVAIRSLTSAVEKKMFDEKTTILALSTLNGILSSDFPYFSKPFFKDVLNQDVRVAIIAAAFDPCFETAPFTAALVLTVWRRFSYKYAEGLNEILDSGLTIALSSPDYRFVRRACHVFRVLCNNPLIFVDSFVNFDCDQSGTFKNIFENSFNIIVKNAYPTTESKTLQKTALTTLSNILFKLWEFYQNPPQTKTPPNITESIIAAKQAKDIFTQGVILFKESPKKGLQFFIKNNAVANDPVEIGKFLFNTALPGASVGEIIGTKTNVEILKSYVSCFDFKGLAFEKAFRKFLSSFIIPGEGQMIDRIMEKFGQHYYEQNPGVFSCADTVYVLAYSALMLHTDAHHPTIKKHMTLDEFIRNNRGIDNGKDLPKDFLEELYNGIRSEKIFVSQDSIPNMNLISRQQRMEIYQQQCQATLAAARQHITGDKHQFHHVDSPLLLGPMLQRVWGPLCAALSISLEETNDQRIIDLCLSTMQSALKIAARCYVEDALQSLLDALAKFARLRYEGDKQEPKNKQCAQALMQFVFEERENIKGAWSVFLDEVSAMESIKDSSPNVKEYLQKAEDLYKHSKQFDRESICEFVRAMSIVAVRETEENPPRFYMLKSMAEVALYNMDRERIVWNDIWIAIAPNIVYAGSHKNTKIGTFAINLMESLAEKFLVKEETSAFHFQEHFLQPMLDIYYGASSQIVHKALIESIGKLVGVLHKSFHSGWTVILHILSEAAKGSARDAAFNTIQNVIVNYPEDIAPYTSEVLDTLTSFSIADKSGEKAMTALTFFAVVADFISEDAKWENLFANLKVIAVEMQNEVRTLACEITLEIILKYGCSLKRFSPALIEKLLTIILPDVVLSGGAAEFQVTLVKEIFDQEFNFPDSFTHKQIAVFIVSLIKKEGIHREIIDATLDCAASFFRGKNIDSEVAKFVNETKGIENFQKRLSAIVSAK